MALNPIGPASLRDQRRHPEDRHTGVKAIGRWVEEIGVTRVQTEGH